MTEAEQTFTTEVYLAYHGEITRYVTFLLWRYPGEVEDAVAEVFARAWVAHKKGKLLQARRWLFTVAQHHVIDLVRHRRLKTFVSLDAPLTTEDESLHYGDCLVAPADEIARWHDGEEVEWYLSHLDERQHAVLARTVAGYADTEILREGKSGLSTISSLRMYRTRARKHLQTLRKRERAREEAIV